MAEERCGCGEKLREREGFPNGYCPEHGDPLPPDTEQELEDLRWLLGVLIQQVAHLENRVDGHIPHSGSEQMPSLRFVIPKGASQLRDDLAPILRRAGLSFDDVAIR